MHQKSYAAANSWSSSISSVWQLNDFIGEAIPSQDWLQFKVALLCSGIVVLSQCDHPGIGR